MKFKCKVSGTVAEFLTEYDIKAMLKHPQYEVVEDVVIEEVKEKKKPIKEIE